jgi:hypothetical protein
MIVNKTVYGVVTWISDQSFYKEFVNLPKAVMHLLNKIRNAVHDYFYGLSESEMMKKDLEEECEFLKKKIFIYNTRIATLDSFISSNKTLKNMVINIVNNKEYGFDFTPVDETLYAYSDSDDFIEKFGKISQQEIYTRHAWEKRLFLVDISPRLKSSIIACISKMENCPSKKNRNVIALGPFFEEKNSKTN